MGRYSRKDMIEFAKFAKSYQSSRGVEEAYQAYLMGARLKPPNWKNSPVRLLQQANIAYIDGKLVKRRINSYRYGNAEIQMPFNVRFSVESWDGDKRILHLKTI